MTKENEMLVNLIKQKIELETELDNRLINHIKKNDTALDFWDVENNNLQYDLDVIGKKMLAIIEKQQKTQLESMAEELKGLLGKIFKDTKTDDDPNGDVQ